MGNISAREIALRVLIEYPGRAKPDELLERYLEDFDPERRERALATHLVSGTIKWRRRLDYVIRTLSRKGRAVSPLALNALRISLYQLMFLDKVPDYSATSEGVELVKKYGDRFEANYVNAILRRFLRDRQNLTFPDLEKDPVRHISTVWSHPPWLIRRYLRRYSIEETIKIVEANNRIPDIGLRANLLRASLEDLRKILIEDGAEVVSQGFAGLPHLYVRGLTPIESARSYREGLFQVQDAASTLAGRIVSPRPGSRIIDLCSAPGGKVTHLYEIVRGRATVVAADVSFSRLLRVRMNAERLGHDGMMFAIGDARQPGFHNCDFVLVDAPCTGLGVLARRWDLRWSKREADIQRMAALQVEILTHAIDVAGRGGFVVYSTCSIEPEENEGVVETVIKRRKDVRLSDISPLVPADVVYKYGMMLTLPHVHGVDGMFAARLERC